MPAREEARPFVDRLERAHPGLEVERVEVRRSRDGARRFVAAMARGRRTGARHSGVRSGREAVLGYRGADSERAVERLIAGRGVADEATIDLPSLER